MAALTPDEAAARNIAIKECAKIAEEFRRQLLPGDRSIARKIEDAILALATPDGE